VEFKCNIITNHLLCNKKIQMEARAVAAPGAEVAMAESDEPDAEVQGEVRILCKWNSNVIL
jgi:hypothetical protein